MLLPRKKAGECDYGQAERGGRGKSLTGKKKARLLETADSCVFSDGGEGCVWEEKKMFHLILIGQKKGLPEGVRKKGAVGVREVKQREKEKTEKIFSARKRPGKGDDI